MKTDENIISISKISKSFGEHNLFDHFEMTVEKNTIHALIGPNGSGKTSLLRILTGLYAVDNGEIDVRGSHCMLLENDYLYEDKSGTENIKIFSLYFDYALNGYEKYAQMLNLDDQLSKPVSSYSKGMKRKLSLLIVILMNRDIMYLDEPTSGVDPISRIEIRSIIEKLRDSGKTIVITSHDLSEVEKIADYITMIKDGSLVFKIKASDIQSGSLEDIFIEAGKKDV